MTIYEIALSYFKKGFSVIPLKSPAMVEKSPAYLKRLEASLARNATLIEPRKEEVVRKELLYRECKQALIPWKEYQTRRQTEDEVRELFYRFPNAGIGIVTGAISNLVVFDLDSPDAVKFAEEQGGFPDSVKVKTGKGYHVYMKHPGFEIRNSVNKHLDIDIRADGGYVVAPPSIHGSGHPYTWEEGYSIFEIDPAPCAPWMTDYLEAVNRASEEPKDKTVKEASVSSSKQKSVSVSKQANTGKTDFARILSEGAVQGERNDTAARLLGHLLKANPKDDAWEILSNWNTKNNPPLDEEELKGIFNSIAKAEDNSKGTKEKETTISIDKFLDNPNSVLAEYNQNYVRVPFAYNDDLNNFQSLLNGGLAGGNLYILGGIPSSGKTGLLNCIGDNICLQGNPVLYFSYDDGKSELRYRTFARFSEYNIEGFNGRTITEFQKIFTIPRIKQIMPLKYVIQEMISVENWSDLVDQIIQKHGKGPVIMIDYLRKLKLDNGTGDERLRIDTIMGKLTELAKEKNIPIIAISELARDSYKGGQRLSMASFKESGSIEYEASWLGILAAVEEVEGENGNKEFKMKQNWENIIEHDGNIDLIVFKAKRGTGSTGKVPLKIDRKKMIATDRMDDDSALPQDATAYQPPKKVKKSRY